MSTVNIIDHNSQELSFNGELRDKGGTIVAKVSVVLTLTAVASNAPPQYTGETVINDLVINVGRQLEGFDPDSDPITWSVDPANAAQVSVSPSGVLTPLVALDGAAVTVFMDDGKG